MAETDTTSSSIKARTKARKKVYCDVCKTFISSEFLLPMHNSGKKHQRLLKSRMERQACAEQSIYVRGFSNTCALESDISGYFCKFGNVSNVFVDKEKTEYAIVEFDCPSVVKTILSSKELPLFHGKHLIIKQRSIKDHTTKKQETMLVSNKVMGDVAVNQFLDEDIIDNMKQANTINDQVELLVSSTCLTEDDNKLRKLIVQYLHEIFVEVFPECDIQLFGSSSTGLGLKGADLDLSLFVDSLSLVNQVQQLNGDDSSPSDDIAVQLEFIVQLLKQFAAGFQNIVSVPSARCPLVKFIHRDSGLSCDLSINNRLAIRNTELIKLYATLDERVRLLAITLKNWGGAKQLTGSGGRQISNYSVVLMLLHFLQHTNPPVVPVLQRTVDGHDMIDGWDCSFGKTELTNVNKQSFGDLLRDWFYYYAHTFDYGNEVITIQHGRSVLKTENIVQVCGKDTFKVSPLSVQDPFELSHNLTQSVSVEFLRRFIQSCMDAYSLFSPTNDSSSNIEHFVDIFATPAHCAVKPQKGVHFFTIPLLVSEKMANESEIDELQRTCEFISNILIHDLRVSSELQSGEPVASASKEKSYKGFDNAVPTCSVVKISLPFGKRPRDENETIEMMDVKKVKLCGESKKKKLVLLCKASHITWQNRRRQRRLERRSDSGTDDCHTDDTLSVESSLPKTNQEDMQVDEHDIEHDTKYLLQSSSEKFDKIISNKPISSPSKNIIVHNSSCEKPLLIFKLKLELINNVPSNDNSQCLITLYHVNGPLHQFSTFYAFFKKHVMNKLTKC